MLNVALVTDSTSVALAVNVYPVPARSMLKSPNRATPKAGTTDRVPLRMPPTGFEPSGRREARLLSEDQHVYVSRPATSRRDPLLIGHAGAGARSGDQRGSRNGKMYQSHRYLPGLNTTGPVSRFPSAGGQLLVPSGGGTR